MVVSLIVALVLFIGIPFGSVMLVIKASKAGRKQHAVSPLACALAFGIAVALGVAWVGYYLKIKGFFVMGIPVSSIAATLAVLGQSFLVDRSKLIAILSGIGIIILSAVIMGIIIGCFLIPVFDYSVLVAFVFSLAIFAFPINYPVLLAGGIVGYFINDISRKKRSKMQSNSLTPTVGATELGVE